jgi:hypothetical protein
VIRYHRGTPDSEFGFDLVIGNSSNNHLIDLLSRLVLTQLARQFPTTYPSPFQASQPYADRSTDSKPLELTSTKIASS